MSRKTTTLLLLLLSLAGLADSLYLTYDHGAFHADPAGYGGGLCGAEGGCEISRTSALSEIPLPGAELGLPTSVLALGFYVVFIVLTLLRHHASGPSPTRTWAANLPHLARLMLGLAVLANVYSLFLFGYSLAEGSVCKFCAVLYVVNAGLLVVTWKTLGEPIGAAFKAIAGAITSRSGGVATLVMLLALAGGYIVYRTTVLSARAKAPVVKVDATVDTSTRPTKGPADAPVQILEFADFECPHCKLAFHILEEVLAERSDVRVSFMHFPLDQACNRLIDRPFHARACELALIGECAHAQGRFFDVAPLLFEDHPTPTLLDKIGALGLDRKALEACTRDPQALARVKGDIEMGLAAEIGGTPAVFLNGVLVGGAVPKDKLNGLIDAAKKAPSLNAPDK